MASRILLTGRPGVGKTTVIRKVLAGGIPLAGGFTTEEMRLHGSRVGFRVTDVFTGAHGILAHADRKGPPRVGKYGVDVESFERVGVAALRESLRRPGCVIIDEIGKMELFSEAFRQAVGEAMGSGRPLLATIGATPHPFIRQLKERKDVVVLTVTVSNRDALVSRVLELLRPSDRSRP